MTSIHNPTGYLREYMAKKKRPFPKYRYISKTHGESITFECIVEACEFSAQGENLPHNFFIFFLDVKCFWKAQHFNGFINNYIKFLLYVLKVMV